MKQAILALITITTLAGCSLLPKHISESSTGDHAHTPEQASNPDHHNEQNDTMREHCKTMPNMTGCEAYITSGSTNHSGHTMNHADMIQSEFDFITLMIPHHQEAVDTSTWHDEYPTTGLEGLDNLAKNITIGQTKEIEMMKGWLNQWYSGIKYEGMGYMPMMRPLNFEGTGNEGWKNLKIQWAEDMIIHHQGAVDMAKKLLKIMDIKDQLIKVTGDQLQFRNNLRTFANDIITTQTKEIKEMNTILKK